MRLIAALLLGFSSLTHADIQIHEPIVRLLPPGVPNTAAYLKLTNTGSEPRILLGGESDWVEKVELHNHLVQDGMMKMVRQHEVAVGPGETLVFQPGGLHIMLFGLKAPLEEGETKQIRLLFANGEKIQIEARVAKETSNPSHSHHHE
ncbi:copper chaperone PCu(A)C [Bowmanella dokdonensis]|uniref:Copper chaperone PCu(A)C n=1 Tax=Bowmanella dokdonensis TaxID=751969 RepID=A0A939DRF4_9ALTE|nr:copper chaperone PCu(A)C [Bowmanella dokdonensis]MBN7827420.1 copper chaperone PCu(A)C [Bowmanella dokdonensis]